MMFRAAVALLALALPAFAQHGGAHAGSSGSRGFSGNAGFSSHPSFSQPSFSRPSFSQSPNFARPAQPARYGTSYGSQYRYSSGAGYRDAGPAGIRSHYTANRYTGTYSGNRYTENRLAAGRPSYSPAATALSRSSDRDRFDARRRQFHNWYVNTYPNLLGYPYLLNPNFYNLGLYDWSDSDNSVTDDSVSDQNALAPYPDQGSQYPDPSPAYPDERDTAPNQIAEAAPGAPAPAQPLTVFFKTGRDPMKIQNYLITAKVLTDLDSEHYEQIPLDEINLAATQNFNKVAGVEFQIPSQAPRASRD
jgi:hypothetical protein